MVERTGPTCWRCIAPRTARTRERQALQAAGQPPSEITIAIILVEFSDVKLHSYTESDWDDMFLDTSYTGISLRTDTQSTEASGSTSTQ